LANRRPSLLMVEEDMPLWEVEAESPMHNGNNDNNEARREVEDSDLNDQIEEKQSEGASSPSSQNCIMKESVRPLPVDCATPSSTEMCSTICSPNSREVGIEYGVEKAWVTVSSPMSKEDSKLCADCNMEISRSPSQDGVVNTTCDVEKQSDIFSYSKIEEAAINHSRSIASPGILAGVASPNGFTSPGGAASFSENRGKQHKKFRKRRSHSFSPSNLKILAKSTFTSKRMSKSESK